VHTLAISPERISSPGILLRPVRTDPSVPSGSNGRSTRAPLVASLEVRHVPLFFHLRDGKQLVHDSEGRELDCDDRALDKAKRLAAQYARAMPQGTRPDLVVELVASARRIVGTIPLPH